MFRLSLYMYFKDHAFFTFSTYTPVYTTPQSGLSPDQGRYPVNSCYLDSNLDSNQDSEPISQSGLTQIQSGLQQKQKPPCKQYSWCVYPIKWIYLAQNRGNNVYKTCSW